VKNLKISFRQKALNLLAWENTGGEAMPPLKNAKNGAEGARHFLDQPVNGPINS